MMPLSQRILYGPAFCIFKKTCSFEAKDVSVITILLLDALTLSHKTQLSLE